MIVIVDQIQPYGVTLLEDLIYDAVPEENLHVLLQTPGGDGETAVRLVRSAQARCKELTIIVPDQAKSAGTILCLGADWIGMGPTSDLGPVDAQLILPDGKLHSAKSIIAAVDAAEAAVQLKPESFPIHASLLAPIDALIVQRARASLARGGELVRESLRSNPSRSDDDVEAIATAIQEKLIDTPTSHGAIFGQGDATDAGLPVLKLDPAQDQWRLIWRLWTKYFITGQRWYEGRRASKCLGAWL